MARKVQVYLLRYIKTTQKGWLRCPVRTTRTGRGWRQQIAVPQGLDVVAEGEFQLRWRKNNTNRFKGVGYELGEAVLARDKQERMLVAEKAALEAGRRLEPERPERKALAQEREAFLERKRMANKDPETVSAYQQLTAEFLSIAGKTFVDEITDLDLLSFCDALRKRNLAERTVKNYYGFITAFLKFCKIDHKELVPKADRPHAEDPPPEVFDRKEIERFLAACSTERDRLAFEFLLKTGARAKELAFAEWTDINWAQNCITIKGEKKLNLPADGGEKRNGRLVYFCTKTRKGRDLPLESELSAKLKCWHKNNPGSRFIFGTRSDLPNGHLLETCKKIAHKAGLNCGQCRSCVEKKECENWYLHRFRHTFATWALQQGVDIRTLQFWLGHTKIEMTARYLSPARGMKAQKQVNGVFRGLKVNAPARV
jgi:integrase